MKQIWVIVFTVGQIEHLIALSNSTLRIQISGCRKLSVGNSGFLVHWVCFVNLQSVIPHVSSFCENHLECMKFYFKDIKEFLLMPTSVVTVIGSIIRIYIYTHTYVASFYPWVAVKYFIYSVSEGTKLAFRNFLQSCIYAFYNNTKLPSNLISESLFFKNFLGKPPDP